MYNYPPAPQQQGQQQPGQQQYPRNNNIHHIHNTDLHNNIKILGNNILNSNKHNTLGNSIHNKDNSIHNNRNNNNILVNNNNIQLIHNNNNRHILNTHNIQNSLHSNNSRDILNNLNTHPRSNNNIHSRVPNRNQLRRLINNNSRYNINSQGPIHKAVCQAHTNNNMVLFPQQIQIIAPQGQPGLFTQQNGYMALIQQQRKMHNNMLKDGVFKMQLSNNINFFKQMMMSQGTMITTVQKIFMKYDVDRDGTVDRNEFYPARCELQQQTSCPPPPYSFALFYLNSFDCQNKGSLTVKEFSELSKVICRLY